MGQDRRVSTTFPRVRSSKRGYAVNEVEDFLEEARRAYSADRAAPTVVTAESIRRTAFDMEKGGYSVIHVDAALERLEDARRLAQAIDLDQWAHRSALERLREDFWRLWEQLL